MSGKDLPIADTPEALTAQWLTAALTAGGHLDGVQVSGVAVKPLGTGQMCDSWRLALSYDGVTDAPQTVVAKLPAANETSRSTAVMMRSYEKEVRFYQQVAPSLPMRTPAAYHADIDVATASFVLLLEDMAPAEQGDQLAGCSPDMAAIAVDELVRLHAPMWDAAELDTFDWLAPAPPELQAMMHSAFPMLWQGFCERYETVLAAHAREAGEVLFSNLGGYFAETPGPRTIVHDDYRLDNLLFDMSPGGTPIAVVDWQTVRIGTAASDVAYFIGAGLLEDDRREHEEALQRRYFDALVDAGVKDYDWDRFLADYRKGTWAGVVMAVGASMMVERTDRGDEMFMAMISRHSRHALDLDAADTIT